MVEDKRLKSLEDENSRLKKLLAGAMIDAKASIMALNRNTDRLGASDT